MIGRMIDGRFTITEHLGSGGMGAVYRALQHSIDRQVALKLLRPEHLSDEAAVRRFFREARAASRLANPHTITVFDFGQSTDGLFYIAMELLRGRPLSRLSDSDPQPMAPALAALLVDQVLESLEEAHREGVIHRDLKTENIFVLEEPARFVKVLDFGLAKSAGGEDAGITRTGITIGTPAFMSPEQACGEELDARSDLYAVGVVLFELLTGQTPFGEMPPIALIVRKLQDRAPTMAEVAPNLRIPPKLDALVTRLLSIDRAGRPASATEVRRLLREAVEGLQEPLGPVPRTIAVPAGQVQDTVPSPLLPRAAHGTRPGTPRGLAEPSLQRVLDGSARKRILEVLTRAIGLAGEGWTLYDQAVTMCTSRPGKDLFGAYMARVAAGSERLRRAASRVQEGRADWSVEAECTPPPDPASQFEQVIRAHIPAIQGDAHLGRALDAAMAFERRTVEFWEVQQLAGDVRFDPAFLRRCLIEAKDRVASLAEVKLRVIGLMRGAGFNSLYMRLAGQLPVRSVRTGDTLFREGEPGDSMVVVVKGAFRLEVRDRQGQVVMLGEVGPGEVVGEMSCLDPAPRSATVVATSDAEVCVVDRGTLNALRDKDTATYVAVIRAVTAQVADRVRDTDRRIEAQFRQQRPAASPSVGGDPATRIGPVTRSEFKLPVRTCTFGPGDAQVLAQVARTRFVRHGEWVCREGEPGNDCFVVKSGHLEVVKRMHGDELVLAVLAEGSVVGQFVLVDGGPRSASVRAVGDGELLELDRTTFERLVDAHVPLALRFQEQLAVTGIRQLRLADRWLARLLRRRDQAPQSDARAGDPRGGKVEASPEAGRVGTGDTMARIEAYLRTALREWDMSLEDLDQVGVVLSRQGAGAGRGTGAGTGAGTGTGTGTGTDKDKDKDKDKG